MIYFLQIDFQTSWFKISVHGKTWLLKLSFPFDQFGF